LPTGSIVCALGALKSAFGAIGERGDTLGVQPAKNENRTSGALYLY
jgi:hypothetical protein